MLSRKGLKEGALAGVLSTSAILLSAAPALAQDPNEAAGQAAGAGLGLVFTGCYCLFLIGILALFGVWVWMLIDCVMRKDEEFPEGQSKVMWLLILIFTSYIGMIFYYFMVKKKIPRSA